MERKKNVSTSQSGSRKFDIGGDFINLRQKNLKVYENPENLNFLK